MPVSRVQRSRDYLAHLRNEGKKYLEAHDTLARDERFAEAWKKKQLAELRAAYDAEARRLAVEARDYVNAALAAKRRELQEAHAESERTWNWQRIGVLQREFEAALTSQADLRPVGQRIAHIYNRYSVAGDAEALRALRTVAGSRLAPQESDSPQERGRLAEIRAAFKADEEQERAPIRDIEFEISELQSIGAHVLDEAGRLRQTINGPSYSTLRPPDAWDKEVFGITTSDFVVWREPAEPIAAGGNGPLDTPATPTTAPLE